MFTGVKKFRLGRPGARDGQIESTAPTEPVRRIDTLAGCSVPWPASVAAITVILALAALAVWTGPGLGGGISIGDSFAFFIPMYSFMGEQLRNFNIPGWNPYILSGAPFAGDPESGWMYFPAMVFFTLLPPVAAYTAYAFFHLALAGVTTFALGRLFGFGLAGATLAAVAYQFSPFVEGALCCSVRTQIASWLPLALLGVELSLRAQSWLGRVAAWSVAGLAISQMLGGWIGQGAYYGLLAIGAFVLFRSFVYPPLSQPSLPLRLTSLLITGTAVLTIGFGLAAAGVLPRLDATSRSTLAGGVYQGPAAEKASTGGWHPILALDRILSADQNQGRWYIGAALFTLAIVGLFVARDRPLALFLALTSAAVVILTLDPTPLHQLLYLLPQFRVLHEHVPSRALVVFFLGPALLAGMAVDAFVRPTMRSRPLWLAVLLPPALIIASQVVLASRRREIGNETIIAVFTTSLVLGIAAVLATEDARIGRFSRSLRTVAIPIALIILIVGNPAGPDVLGVLAREGTAIPRVTNELRDLPCLGRTSGAALALQQKNKHEPFRFFGYDSAVFRQRNDPYPNYHGHLREARVQRLLTANQSMCLGLQDIQGYNPVQSLRYVEFITALNGVTQDYHESDILPQGTRSPLLNLLNAVYVVVPADADFLEQRQFRKYPVFYQDADDLVLTRPQAFPRAWLVHQAQTVAPGQALELLVSQSVDPAETALLESEPPPLAIPEFPAREKATVTRYEPDQIELQVNAAANGLVVLSEVWDPGWTATVDGQPSPLFIADHVLRAIPVAAGDHTVTLRYDPSALRVGLLITAATAVVLIGYLAWAGLRSRKDSSRG